MLKDTSERQRTPEKASEHSGTEDDRRDERARAAWLSPAEAVEYSGIKRTRLSGYLTSGAIPSAKLGRTRHIRRRDLDAFLEARMRHSSGE